MRLQFINREDELRALENANDSTEAAFYIIYGRRRIGKTSLVKHFINGKSSFYFQAKEQNLHMEFDRFKRKFSKNFDIYSDANDWESFFSESLSKIDERLVLVIDEYPYWIMKDRSILSEFQHLWDEHLSQKNVFLILLGSSVSMMENEVLGHKSPLYGRRTGQIHVQAMGIKNLREFFPDYSIPDLIQVYGCLDTVPYYLTQFKPDVDFWTNVRRTFLNSTHPLYQDAEILLNSELRKPNVYFNIIRAIMEGATKLGEIANSARVDITNMPKYLNRLIKLQIIHKTRPLVSPKEKRYLYELTDNYFRFWLSYIFPYYEEIEIVPDQHLDFIRETYPAYMGRVFEKFCENALSVIRSIPFSKKGRWWYKGQEIDIVATNERTKEILFCECKWQDQVNASKLLEELKAKAEAVQWGSRNRKEHYAIFARSFKKNIVEDNVFLYDLEDIRRELGWSDMPIRGVNPTMPLISDDRVGNGQRKHDGSGVKITRN